MDNIMPDSAMNNIDAGQWGGFLRGEESDVEVGGRGKGGGGEGTDVGRGGGKGEEGEGEAKGRGRAWRTRLMGKQRRKFRRRMKMRR